MKYELANGEILTDEDIERECAEYEAGTWEGGLKNYRVGRPRYSDEDLGTVVFKAPLSKIAAMERKAVEQGVSKSEFMRNAMDRAIA